MKELSKNELMEVEGGLLGVDDAAIGLGLAVAGAAIYVYNNWGDFAAGFRKGMNETY
jgi:lactobin A/cerein 7B family class IIb bacteriocin